MRVYKVVREEHGLLVSAVVFYAPTHYAIGQTSVPCGGEGPLCAFASLEAALSFATRELGCSAVILLCDAAPSAQYRVWKYHCATFKRHILDLPFGTVLCDSITPIEEVLQ